MISDYSSSFALFLLFLCFCFNYGHISFIYISDYGSPCHRIRNLNFIIVFCIANYRYILLNGDIIHNTCRCSRFFINLCVFIRNSAYC